MFICLLLGVGLAWYVQVTLFEKRWDKGLTVEATFEDAYIYEGERSAIKEVVTNDKSLPLPALEVRLSVDRSLSFLKEGQKNTRRTDKNYKRDLFTFLPKQRVIRTIPFVGRKRGRYEMDQANVVSHDLFFYHVFNKEYPQNSCIYVYPKRVDASRIRLLSQVVLGMQLSQSRMAPDPFAFHGIRAYERSDPRKNINWKASAKEQQLMVNEFDTTVHGEVTVLMDVSDTGILREEALVEETIRIGAALCGRFYLAQTNFSFSTNGKNKGQEYGCTMKRERGEMHQIQKAFACLDTQGALTTLEGMMQKEQGLHKNGQIYVLLSKNTRETIWEEAQKLTKGNNQVLWIVPSYTSSKEEKRGCVTQWTWEVER